MNVIEVSDLTKRYGDRAAVDGVSFSVEEGEIFGILGPNGAGKTTTVESIVGLRTPDSGTIRVLGLDPGTDRDRLRAVVGVQLQESELPDRITVREALELFASFYDDPADPRRLMDDLGLAEKRDTAYRHLSGGQKQRLSIALALVGQPRIAILDELSTGLDPQARRDTWDLIESIRDRGVTVVLVTHLMEEAERLADRVAVIRDGRVVALDTPAGIVSMVDPEQRLRFRPSAPIEDRLLTDLPEVRSVQRTGPTLVVTGTGNLIGAVTAVLARHEVIANDLRIDQANLDEAYLALTGRPSARTREGAVMKELRTLIATEAKLLFRDPITWLAAIALPSVVLLIFGSLFAPRAGSRARRPALASTCSCRRCWSSRSGRSASRRCPSASRPIARRASCGGCRRRRRTRPGCSSRSSSIYSVTSVIALVLLVVVGQRRLRDPAARVIRSATSSRSSSA